MKIEEVRVFDAPNIYSLREPIVKLKIKLGELADVPTKDIGNINDKIIELFPGVKDHKCCTGYIGGFIDRLKEGTYLAHVTEHLCLETQRMLGYDIKYGKARHIENDIYSVIYACVYPLIGKTCGIFVVDTINSLIAGNIVDMDSELSKLKDICIKYDIDIGIGTGAIISEAKRRGIPVSMVNDGKLVRLGYGKYQELISVTLDDIMFPERTIFTIPIVSITGTNGKTTTTRMISSILMHQGLTVGTTTSQGIYINNKQIVSGDTTGPISARKILHNRKVEAAVLETARGGIIRRGLGYEKADVAVFTNFSRDHIGMDNINTMEELLKVKSLVIEAVKDDGTCVLNADDSWIMRIKEKARGKHILFSVDDKNQVLLDHINKGGTAVYRRNNEICIHRGGNFVKSIDITDIPATLEGKLVHNIYNSMAAIGACLALEVSFDIIKRALSEFTCDASNNPGRFNIYDLGNFKIIIDFGHNIDGYRFTLQGLKALEASRLVGILRAPGDRLDADIINIGKISGMTFDHIIIREDKDLRGRQPLAVANLLHHGALTGSISNEHIEIIPDEQEALKKAIKDARSGDVIIIFFEKMEPLIKIIEEHKTHIYNLI